MKIVDLVEGAKNYIEYSGIKPGEEVMVLAPNHIEKETVEVVSAMARAAGATVVVSYVSLPDLPFSEPPRQIIQAAIHCDTILDLGINMVGHSRAFLTAMMEYRTKGVILASSSPNVLTCEASRFPNEVIYKIGEKVFNKCLESKTIQITDKRGSNVRSIVNVTSATGNPGGARPRPAEPGDFGVFPGIACGWWPEWATNGEAYFDSFTKYGRVSKPLHIVVEEGWVTKIDGCAEAEDIYRMIRNVPNAMHLCEIMWGLNPKARTLLDAKPLAFEAERSSQTMHIGMGASKLLGGRVASPSHLDGTIVKPTIKLDGEPIMEDGHLLALDDPDVRAVASKYGDPDRLLAEVPIQ